MAEYIEREALLAGVEKRLKNPAIIGWLTSIIADIPAADVVPVVRCRDCKYYNEDCMSPHSGWCECLERAEYNEHHCSYGERRGDTDD